MRELQMTKESHVFVKAVIIQEKVLHRHKAHGKTELNGKVVA